MPEQSLLAGDLPVADVDGNCFSQTIDFVWAGLEVSQETRRERRCDEKVRKLRPGEGGGAGS